MIRKKNVVLILSIILNILLIVFLYFAFVQGISSSCKDYPIYNRILSSKMISGAKSGDLLLFSNSRCSVITRTFGNPYYSHIGIVIEKEGKLYSLELVREDNVYKGKPKMQNVIMIPLDDRVRDYSGQVFHCRLMNALSEENKAKLISISQKSAEYKITRACGAYIADILDELKLFKKVSSWRIWAIHDSIIGLCNNTVYSNPVLVIHDELMINDLSENKQMNYC